MKFSLYRYKNKGNIPKTGNRQWQASALRNALLTTISTCKDFNGSEIDAISKISTGFIKELAKQGREETIMNLRLLGNWLRINKFNHSILAEMIKDISWGINAGALIPCKLCRPPNKIGLYFILMEFFFSIFLISL